jgi:hypothetical protein
MIEEDLLEEKRAARAKRIKYTGTRGGGGGAGRRIPYTRVSLVYPKNKKRAKVIWIWFGPDISYGDATHIDVEYVQDTHEFRLEFGATGTARVRFHGKTKTPHCLIGMKGWDFETGGKNLGTFKVEVEQEAEAANVFWVKLPDALKLSGEHSDEVAA